MDKNTSMDRPFFDLLIPLWKPFSGAKPIWNDGNTPKKLPSNTSRPTTLVCAMSCNQNPWRCSKRWENGWNSSNTALLRLQTETRIIKNLITPTSWIVWSQSKINSTSIISFKATQKLSWLSEINSPGPNNLSISGFNSHCTWRKIRLSSLRKEINPKKPLWLKKSLPKDQLPQRAPKLKFKLKRVKNPSKKSRRIQSITEQLFCPSREFSKSQKDIKRKRSNNGLMSLSRQKICNIYNFWTKELQRGFLRWGVLWNCFWTRLVRQQWSQSTVIWRIRSFWRRFSVTRIKWIQTMCLRVTRSFWRGIILSLDGRLRWFMGYWEE